MGAFVGLVTFIRAMTAPIRGVKTDKLVEILTIPSGPLKARVGDWAIEQWPYPDFSELRHADTGMAITGWAIDESPIESPMKKPSASGRCLSRRIISVRSACHWRAVPDSIRQAR